jgi:transcriptional regulator with XRE-family HTH domain
MYLYIYKLNDSIIHMDVKNEIKAAIYEAGYDLKKVAEAIGISEASLSNMLSRRSIRYDTAKKIAEAINYELKFKPKL